MTDHEDNNRTTRRSVVLSLRDGIYDTIRYKAHGSACFPVSAPYHVSMRRRWVSNRLHPTGYHQFA